MNFTYRTVPHTYLAAILHMVGQMDDIGQPVTTSDVAHWLRVHKQTAAKYLKQLESEKRLLCKVSPYHHTATIYTWQLSPIVKQNYRLCKYREAYDDFRESRGLY
jgi:hypothetical protein